jgi:hypothetical protein
VLATKFGFATGVSVAARRDAPQRMINGVAAGSRYNAAMMTLLNG